MSDFQIQQPSAGTQSKSKFYFFFSVELQIRKAFPKGRELEFPFNLSLVGGRELPRGGERCDGGRRQR